MKGAIENGTELTRQKFETLHKRLDGIEATLTKLREAQIANAKRNGNGHMGHMAASAKKAVWPAGYAAGGGGLLYIIQMLIDKI